MKTVRRFAGVCDFVQLSKRANEHAVEINNTKGVALFDNRAYAKTAD